MAETKHAVFFIYPWDIDALLISRWKGDDGVYVVQCSPTENDA